MKPKKTDFENPIRCGNCRYYHQHYIKWGDPEKNEYRKYGCRHCTQGPRTKKTQWYFVCDAFEEKE